MQLGLLLEIEGCPTAWVADPNYTPPAGLPSWAANGQTYERGLLTELVGGTLSCDPATGVSETSGMDVGLLNLAPLLYHAAQPNTHLSAAVAVGDILVNVESSAGLAAAGLVWVGRECMEYVIAAPNQLLCVRGALGTTPSAHGLTYGGDGVRVGVYDAPHILLGRKAYLWRYSATIATRLFVGVVDGAKDSTAGSTINLLSQASRLQKTLVGRGVGRTATLFGHVDEAGLLWRDRGLYGYGAVAGRGTHAGLLKDIRTFDVALASPFPLLPTAGTKGYIRIDDEVMSFANSIYPAVSTPVDSLLPPVSGVGAGIRTEPLVGGHNFKPLNAGDIIQFTDSATGVVVNVQVVQSLRASSGGLDVYHNGRGLAPAIGATVTTPLRQTLTGIIRGEISTAVESHEVGAEVEGIAVVSGGLADNILRLLVSGNVMPSTYNTLDSSVGAAIPETDIELPSFAAVANTANTLAYTHIISEPTSPEALLALLARATNTRVFLNRNGRIDISSSPALYPTEQAATTIDPSNAVTLPDWSMGASSVLTSWTWRFQGGVEVVFAMPRYTAYYLGEEAPPMDMDGAWATSSMAFARVLSSSMLTRYGRPCPTVTVEVFDTTDIPVGTIVDLRLPVPDGDGGVAHSSTWECVRYSPSTGGKAEVELLYLHVGIRRGLVAPAGLVAAFDAMAQTITLDNSATTHFSPLVAVGAGKQVLLSGGDGTQDGNWFLTADALRVWDVSSFGGVLTTSAVVAANVAGNVITTVGALPAWIAVGDLVRLDNYTAVAATIVGGLRADYYTCIGALPVGVQANRWGE